MSDEIGEKPEFTSEQIEEIKKKTASKIHTGTRIACCSNCGVYIAAPAGSCLVCTNCGSSFGGCG